MRLIALICHLMKRLNISQLAAICILIKSVNNSSWHGLIHDCHMMGFQTNSYTMRYTQTANKQHTTICAGDTPEWIFRHKANPKRSMLLCRKSMYMFVEWIQIGGDFMPCSSLTEPEWCSIYTQIEAFRASQRNQESLWKHHDCIETSLTWKASKHSDQMLLRPSAHSEGLSGREK